MNDAKLLARAQNIAAAHIGWDTYEDAAAHNHHTDDRASVALEALENAMSVDVQPLVNALSDVLDFYDALPTEHAPGEAELLDRIAALIAKTRNPPAPKDSPHG